MLRSALCDEENVIIRIIRLKHVVTKFEKLAWSRSVSSRVPFESVYTPSSSLYDAWRSWRESCSYLPSPIFMGNLMWHPSGPLALRSINANASERRLGRKICIFVPKLVRPTNHSNVSWAIRNNSENAHLISQMCRFGEGWFGTLWDERLRNSRIYTVSKKHTTQPPTIIWPARLSCRPGYIFCLR